MSEKSGRGGDTTRHREASDGTTAALRLGMALADQVARSMCRSAVLCGLASAAYQGALVGISDPDGLIDAVDDAAWRALTWKRWATYSGAANELEYYRHE